MMEGNLLQAVTAAAGLVFIFGACGWSLYSTRQAKLRRIAREKAKAAA